jgi:hypothetical protein
MIFLFGFAASRVTYEIQAFMKEKELDPFKNLKVSLIHVSFSHGNFDFFLIDTFFHSGASVYEFFLCLKRYGQFSGREYAIRRIVLILRSYTICDPYYILPLLTSVTVWATMEVYYYCHFFFIRRISLTTLVYSWERILPNSRLKAFPC